MLSFDPIHFDHRLTVSVPGDFVSAVRSAAESAGLTVADYARHALSERMALDGVAFTPPPLLHRRIEPARSPLDHER